MIGYPLYVTFDTNIIDENQYDFSEAGTLALLGNYVAQGKIKVVLSSIVCNEVKRHLCNRAKRITTLLNNALKDIRKTTSDSFIDYIGYADRIKKQNSKVAQEKAVKYFDDYLKILNPEILDTRNVDTEIIFEHFFNYLPPFEDNDNKRKEFPDAFIAEQIKARFSNGETIAVVSKDKGLNKACNGLRSILFFDSFGDLFNAINKQDEHNYEMVTSLVAEKYKSEIYSRIETHILNGDNVSITGQTVDADGNIDGSEYDEIYIEKVCEITYTVHTIDQILGDKVIATLNSKAVVTALCSYYDYENAAWDREDKKYIFLDRIELREKHIARFVVRVTINIENDDLIAQVGTVLLGPSTRISQEILSYEEFLQDSEDQD